MHTDTVVVACGHTQALVTNQIFFRRNCQRVVAQEVKEIRKTVLVDGCKVIHDKVIINGRLHKDILFTEFARPGSNIGAVADVAAEVGFGALVPARGARPGDRCIVVHAFVAGEEEQPINLDACGGFSGLLDKSVVSICVKVIRQAPCEDCDDWSGGDDASDSSSGDHSDDPTGCGECDAKSGHDHRDLCDHTDDYNESESLVSRGECDGYDYSEEYDRIGDGSDDQGSTLCGS